jgi:uncharacterized repeat protein (TIGR01451 family)
MRKLTVAAFLLVTAAALPMAGQILYGSEWDGSALYEIDPGDGSHTTVGNPPPSNLPGLAFNADTRVMYATDTNGLYTIDLDTAATTLVGDHGITPLLWGLTFNLDYTLLYAVGDDDNFYSINPANGVATLIGPLGVGSLNVLDPAMASDGTIYAAGISNALYTINPATGAATSVGTMTGSATSFTALAFDDQDTLYAIDISSDALYTIDVTTRVTTLVGGDVGGDVRGMAFVPAFAFDTTQTIDGKTVTCSSTDNTATYTECRDLQADGLYFPNGITCGPMWSTTNSLYSDTQGFCESLTGSTNFEAFYTCDFTQSRATWYNHVWGTNSDNGYTQHVRCYYPEPLVVAAPELTATKTAAGSFASGSTITYTIVITNEGDGEQPDNADDEFVDVLPDGLALLSATATSGTVSEDFGSDTVHWNGSLAAGASVTLTIEAAVQASEGTSISNQGTVYFDADNNGSNESSAPTDNPDDATGDADATTVVVGAVVAEIPALSPMMLLALAMLLGMAAFIALRG